MLRITESQKSQTAWTLFHFLIHFPTWWGQCLDYIHIIISLLCLGSCLGTTSNCLQEGLGTSSCLGTNAEVSHVGRLQWLSHHLQVLQIQVLSLNKVQETRNDFTGQSTNVSSSLTMTLTQWCWPNSPESNLRHSWKAWDFAVQDRRLILDIMQNVTQ